MDVFGAENLEEIVEKALRETGFSLRSDIGENEISLNLKEGIGPASQIDFYPVFERLYDPESGYLAGMDEFPDFAVRRVKSFPVGWGDEYKEVTEEANLERKEIERIQNNAIEDSFVDGYSQKRFRELYEEVK